VQEFGIDESLFHRDVRLHPGNAMHSGMASKFAALIARKTRKYASVIAQSVIARK
jgi:hypothetical protein